MTRVLALGTFDRLHPGHEHYLREAARLGDELVVVVARDATVHEVKGRPAVQDEFERLAAIEAVPGVTTAVLGRPGDKLRIVEEIHPDVIALGYDQRSFTTGLQEELARRGLHPRIVRIGAFRPEAFKSSKLRKD